MSAYIVQDDCINSIVTWMTGRGQEWERSRVTEALESQGTIGDSFEEKLGNAMFELNCNAVEQRYGDGQAKEFRTLDYAFEPSYLGSGYAVYDRLGEWIYQCSEGDVPESSKLFRAMETVYGQMAHTFFRGLRERKDDADKQVRVELVARIEKLEAQFKLKRVPVQVRG